MRVEVLIGAQQTLVVFPFVSFWAGQALLTPWSRGGLCSGQTVLEETSALNSTKHQGLIMF